MKCRESEGKSAEHGKWIFTKPYNDNCNNLEKLIVMLLHKPHFDSAGISQTAHELLSPPSAVCAVAKSKGDTGGTRLRRLT